MPKQTYSYRYKLLRLLKDHGFKIRHIAQLEVDDVSQCGNGGYLDAKSTVRVGPGRTKKEMPEEVQLALEDYLNNQHGTPYVDFRVPHPYTDWLFNSPSSTNPLQPQSIHRILRKGK
jgi:hypothetical protein